MTLKSVLAVSVIVIAANIKTHWFWFGKTITLNGLEEPDPQSSSAGVRLINGILSIDRVVIASRGIASPDAYLHPT